MKITISPTGEISVDTNGSHPGEVVGLIRELQKKSPGDPVSPTRPVQMNDLQGALYDWIVANDCESGVHLSAVARHFEISNGAARHRLYTLVGMGFIRQVGSSRSGLYRAVTE